MAIVSEGIELVAKNGTKSFVWNYFGLIPDRNGRASDERSPVRKICRIPVPEKSGNTSNLLSHLRNNHSRAYTSQAINGK